MSSFHDTEANEIAYDIAHAIVHRGDFSYTENPREIRLILDSDSIMDPLDDEGQGGYLLGYLREMLEDKRKQELLQTDINRLYNLISFEDLDEIMTAVSNLNLSEHEEIVKKILENEQSRLHEQANNLHEQFRSYNENILETNEALQPMRPQQPMLPPIPNIQSLNTGSISEDDIKTLPKEVQDTILDPITFTIMSDPVINSQGRTYDRSTLMKIIEDGSQSQSGVPVDPFTRQPISVDIIIPNIAIRDLIQRYFPKAGGRRKLTKKKKSKKSKKYRKSRKR